MSATATSHPAWFAALPKPAFFAMIHVGALPGTPRAAASIGQLRRTAAAEAKLLLDGGADAIILENMHDAPYLRGRVGPEIVAAMTAAASAVRAAVPCPLGVQVLAAANRAALAVALAADLQFIRAENFVFAHVADEGLMPQADAGPLLRFRRRIGAEAIAVFADLKKKHAAHQLTADVSLAETAQAAEFFGASGVIVTGSATGQPTDEADVSEVRAAIRLPLLVGSGAKPDGLPRGADGYIVGSYLKTDGAWFNPPQRERVRAMADAIRRLRA